MSKLNFKSKKRGSGGMGRGPRVALRLFVGGIVLAGILIRTEVGA